MRVESKIPIHIWRTILLPDMYWEEEEMKKKFGKAVITCLEHGCTNTIAYDNEDYEVPLYCSKHRTDDGRHSHTRVLKKTVKEKKE
jgi:phenylacetate-coenzyme A ligase PaaK-like adenylate-forming protein